MASKVGIINMGLALLGDDALTSTSEDSEAARAANVFWDILRQEVLRAHPWNFARKRVALARLGATPAFGYSYQYQLPSDCLRAVALYDTDSPWEIEGRALLVDDSTARLLYIGDVTDTGTFDALFTSALAKRLGQYLAYNITGNRTLAEDLDKAWRADVSLARLADAQESGDQAAISAESWINSRGA